MLDEAKKLLDGRFRPDRYNVGVNMGASAGQTVMHCHIHLIPRRSGGQCQSARGRAGRDRGQGRLFTERLSPMGKTTNTKV